VILSQEEIKEFLSFMTKIAKAGDRVAFIYTSPGGCDLNYLSKK